MATYNHEAFIAQAIDSVLAQQATFAWELLIADDGSTDRTPVILRDYQTKYPGRIRLYLSDVNTNDNAIFATAWNDAQGRYVAMLDGDDYWTSPVKLQRQRDFLDANQACSACFHNTEAVWDDRRGAPELINPPGQKPLVYEHDIWVGNMIATCSALYRRSMVGVLPEWYCSAIFGDWSIHMLSASQGPIGYIPEVMAAYRRHDRGQWSGMTPIDQELKAIAFLQQMNALWGRAYDDLAGAGLVRRWLRLAAFYKAAGDMPGFRRSLAQAVGAGVGSRHVSLRWLLTSMLRVVR